VILLALYTLSSNMCNVCIELLINEVDHDSFGSLL
jgi:hypothetical protein